MTNTARMNGVRSGGTGLPLAILGTLLLALLFLSGFLSAGGARSNAFVSSAVLGVRDVAYGLERNGAGVLRIAPDGRVLARAELPEPPTALVVVPQASRVVAVVTGANLAVSLDAVTLSDPRVRRLPHDPTLLATVPGSTSVAVASLSEGTVSLLDARTLDTSAKTNGLEGPHDLRFDPSGERLHVSELDQPRLLSFQTADLAPLSSLAVPLDGGLDHTANTLDGRFGLAVAPGEPHIARLDLNGTPQLIGTVPLPAPPLRAFTGPRSELAWLPSANTPILTRLEIETGNTRTIALDGIANAFAFEPFADTALVMTDLGTFRLNRAGAIGEAWRSGPDITAAATLESSAATLLLDERGGVWRQGAHDPLSPVRLGLSALHAITSVSALSYCH